MIILFGTFGLIILYFGIKYTFDKFCEGTHLTTSAMILTMLVGFLFALLNNLTIYLSIATCSHSTGYSEFGQDLSQFYSMQSSSFLLFIIFIYFLASLLSLYSQTEKYSEWLWSMVLAYQCLFSLLYILPASLIVLILKIPFVLSWAFDWFIYIQGIEFEKIKSVYSLSHHVLNPKLGISSALGLWTYSIECGLGLLLWKRFDVMISNSKNE